MLTACEFPPSHREQNAASICVTARSGKAQGERHVHTQHGTRFGRRRSNSKHINLIDVVIEDADADSDGLKRTMGPLNLTSIGVAAVIGAGIFVVTGRAAAENAGPAVIISFVIAGIVASLSALCYAELASMIPLAGSTYSYAYAAMGTLIAWIIGWDLLVEYLFGAANVASGWSGYFTSLLKGLGLDLPTSLTTSTVADGSKAGGILNVPAMVLIGLITVVLYIGAKLSAEATTVFVAIKLATLAVFVGVGITALNWDNYTPFVPPNEGSFDAFGWTGVIAAAGTVFYSFISFDAVCTAAQEAKHPRRTVPIGVLGSLGIATVLYVLVGFVLVGLVSYTMLDVADPLGVALDGAGLHWVAKLVDVGATIGLAASVMALLYAQTRIMMRMAEDGMLPGLFGRVSPKTKTPVGAILVCGIVGAIMAGVLPSSILTELISIGTLLAFAIVSSAVLVLRKTRPDLDRPFRVPGGPAIPILAVVTSLGIMLSLPVETWIRLVIWLAIGMVIYFTYSRSRAKALISQRLARGERERIARAEGRPTGAPSPDPEAM